MKRVWETEELVEHWTLMPHELALLGNKTGATRLGFALLLKFFQSEARFPKDAHELPEAVVGYVAKQVGVPKSADCTASARPPSRTRTRWPDGCARTFCPASAAPSS
jgi:hypothetical protein